MVFELENKLAGETRRRVNTQTWKSNRLVAEGVPIVVHAIERAEVISIAR